MNWTDLEQVGRKPCPGCKRRVILRETPDGPLCSTCFGKAQAADLSTTVDEPASEAPEQTDTERLHFYEEQIERGMRSAFYECGQGLHEILSRRLYEAAGWKSFEQYTKDRWGLARSRAYQLVDGYRILGVLKAHEMKALPTGERQTRPLAKYADSEETVVGIWETVIEIAQEGEITTAIVQEAVDQHNDQGDEEKLPPAKRWTLSPGMDMEAFAKKLIRKGQVGDFIACTQRVVEAISEAGGVA